LAERAARAEGEDARVADEHQRAQLGGRDALVTDERDALDADLALLPDLELDLDLVVLLRDGL
jgi:hypothetical protein